MVLYRQLFACVLIVSDFGSDGVRTWCEFFSGLCHGLRNSVVAFTTYQELLKVCVNFQCIAFLDCESWLSVNPKNGLICLAFEVDRSISWTNHFFRENLTWIIWSRFCFWRECNCFCMMLSYTQFPYFNALYMLLCSNRVFFEFSITTYSKVWIISACTCFSLRNMYVSARCVILMSPCNSRGS